MGSEPGACLSNLLPPGWGVGRHPKEADRRAQSQEASPGAGEDKASQGVPGSQGSQAHMMAARLTEGEDLTFTLPSSAPTTCPFPVSAHY